MRCSGGRNFPGFREKFLSSCAEDHQAGTSITLKNGGLIVLHAEFRRANPNSFDACGSAGIFVAAGFGLLPDNEMVRLLNLIMVARQGVRYGQICSDIMDAIVHWTNDSGSRAMQ